MTITGPRLIWIATAAARLAAGDAPSISPGGIVNAASFMSGSSSGSGIARGAMFSIFGSGLGPSTPVQATAYPLPAQLGGTSVQVVEGTNSIAAIVIYTSDGQVNAILPSTAADGPAQIVVTYNGEASEPAPITVVDSNIGIFSMAGGVGPGIIQNFNSATDQPLNSLTNPAKPKQYVTIWGTGLGPVPDDTVAAQAGNLPAPVQLMIGGKPAAKLYSGRSPCCAGVDEIVAEVPSDSPHTCYVPVQIQTGGSLYSNIVTMSVSPDGSPCSDSSPFTPLLLHGGASAWLQTLRAEVAAQLGQGASASFTADLGIALFRKLGASGEHAFDMLYSMPSIGTCLSYGANLNLLGPAAMGQLLGLASADALDAGNITISGAQGTMPLAASTGTPGTYMGDLGGIDPLSGDGTTPLFLNPGMFTFSGTGGSDVGAFQAAFAIPSPATWTNRDQIGSVDRSQGVTLTWTGGDPGSQLALIGGLTAGSGLDNSTTSQVGLFFCLAPMGAGSFTIPPSALANLPASSGDLNTSLALLFFGTVPNGASVARVSIPGLDQAFVIPMTLSIETLPYK